MKWLWFPVTAALLLTACSQSGQSAKRSTDAEGGGLHVSVHTLGEGDVQELHLILDPDASEPDPAPAPILVVLRPGDPGLGRDATGRPIVWTWSEEKLPIGAYLISAKAFDRTSPDAGVDPIFESLSVKERIQVGSTASVSLFLFQHSDDPDFNAPHVTAVSFDKAPALGDRSQITVWGDGGVGPLSLSGSAKGKLGRAATMTWDGKGSGDAKAQDGASIDWEPGALGPDTLILTLEDSHPSPNRSSIAIEVNVGHAQGAADFSFVFNHAPWVELQAESTISGAKVLVELEARYGDLESQGLVDYDWDLADCIGKGYAVAPNPYPYEKLTGAIAADLQASHAVVLELAASPLPDPLPVCTITVDVGDRGVAGSPTAVSTSTRSLVVAPGTVNPDTDVRRREATQLVLRSQPANVRAGDPLPALVVELLDADGNLTSSTATVTLQLLGGSGNVPLRGYSPTMAMGGQVTFSGLSVEEVGSYFIQVSSPGLPSVPSDVFAVSPADAAKLVFVQQPASGLKGAPLPEVRIGLFDAFDNPVPDTDTAIDLALQGGGGATLSGGSALTVGGVASFPALSVDTAGPRYTLLATSGTLQQAESEPFAIVEGSAGASERLVFVQQPAGGPAGDDIGTIRVEVQDAGGAVRTAFSDDVQLTILSGPDGAILTGQNRLAATNGVAEFGGLSLDKVGSYRLLASAPGTVAAESDAFVIVAGDPAHLVFQQGPFDVPSLTAMNPAIEVVVLDDLGNVVQQSGIAITLAPESSAPAGATLAGEQAVTVNGVATFAGLQIDKAGGYMLVASGAGLDSLPSQAFTVRPGDADELRFTDTPLAATAGETFSAAVEILDKAGNLVPDAHLVTLDLLGGPGPLQGVDSKQSHAGRAAFDGLRIDAADSGYFLQASVSGLPPVQSDPFPVQAGAPVGVAWLRQPQTVASMENIGPVQVEIRDAWSNPVTGYTDDLEIKLAPSAPAGVSLVGAGAVGPSQGEATFSPLGIAQAGQNYQLLVQNLELGPFASTYFDVVPGDPDQLFFVIQPHGNATGAPLGEVTVGIADAAGNPTDASGRLITLSLQGSRPEASLDGTLQKLTAAGVASFTDLSVDKIAKGYTLLAESAGLASATSHPFDINAGLCPTGYDSCDGACVDLQTNTAHCGACDNDCGGFACVDGACDFFCGDGLVECGGECVDEAFDAAHCGGCGIACAAGEICLHGACAAPPNREWANWPPPSDAPTHYVSSDHMVEDTRTGLIWQRNVLAGGVFTWEGAQDYCQRLRTAGRSDWRVPTAIELISLIDLRGPAPYINQGAFANTPNVDFWTGTEMAKSSANGWYVAFSSGAVDNTGKSNLKAVRCVRGGMATSGPHYEDSPDGLTVRDNWTGLTWVKAADPTTRSQADAAAYCEGLELGGHSDWRLPTRKELESLIDRSRTSPSIAPKFPDVGASWYHWTASPHPLDSTSTFWRIYFTSGIAASTGGTSSYYTRCVRDDRPEPASCGSTRTLCGEVCVDLQDDPTNCGACNVTCGHYEVCATGLCAPAEDYDWANWPLPPEAPSEYVTNGGTVTDLVTGLMWEKNAVDATFSWEDANTYCKLLGTGGYSDWRVPSQAELLSLVNENATNPAINSVFFPNTAPAQHWSATLLSGTPTSAWYVQFNDGSTSTTSIGTAYRVRCVRNGDPFTGTRYDIREDTVRDLKTQLVWQRQSTAGTFSWADAESYCSQLRMEGHDIWRLPTKKELESLVDRRPSSGATIYAIAFPGTAESYFQTASPSWQVHFGNGRTYNRSSTGNVRCVRDDLTGPTVCTGGLDPCDGGCTDFDTDAQNCGGCGITCDEGEMCSAGSCVEAPDREMANWRLPPENPSAYTYDAETVTDTVTGLVWQRNIIPSANFTWDDADGYCRNIRLDGKADWRLPTAIELLSLVSSDVSGPAIYKALFGIDGNGGFWTASPSLDNPASAWYVAMNDGDADETSRTNTYFVRCVRGGDLPPPGPRYQVVAEGVLDQVTQLLWQQDHSPTAITRANAATYCEENVEPLGDWRLPTKKELESLVDRRRADPSIDETFFPGTIANYFWTGTTSVLSSSYDWRVRFTRGATSDSSSSSYIRCVQDVAPPPAGCTGGLVDCGGLCVDLASDAAHCGACEQACAGGEVCSAGSCAAPPDPSQDFDQPNWPLPPEAPLHYVVTAETVTDPVTGLMWERVIEPGTMIGSAAATHCDGRNTGGYTDWRLPSLAELLTLVNSNAKSPAINTAAFPGTPSGRFWSSVLSGSNRWWLDFSSGSTGRNSNTSTSYVSNVRCVRGGSLFAEPRFQVDDESVTDLKTGLSWQRETLASTLTLADAGNYCAQLGAGGFQDWRLPTKKELESLVDRNNSSPSIDSSSFPGTQSSTYWTATMEAGSSTNAWQVSFSTGASSTSSSASYVRCVRDPDAAPPICRDGLNACGGGCTDLLSDAANCGSCDNACAADAFCLEGNCVAAPDREWATWPLPPEVPSDYTVASETVTDPITELVWQRNLLESLLPRSDAEAYCRSLRLEGKADWRLPTLIELLSLVSTDVSNPAINTWAFGSAGTGIFWSASPHPTSSTSGWYLDFASGATSTQSLSTASKVRCVRGGKLPSGPRYDDSNPGTVLDNETGLLWQQTATSTTFSHADAVQYCKTLGTAGYSDWRLPTKKELESLVYRGKANPSIDENFFANTGTGYYWTSTPSGSSFWRVRFNQGASDTTGAGSSHNVRCVRDPVPQITCSSGFTLCGDACVDPQTDPSHCGGCNAAVCGAGEICHQGVCIDEVDLDLLRWPVLGEVREDEDFVVDVEAGTVEDLWTGLTWQRDVLEAGMIQQAAIDYCRNLKLGGRADWRLPSIVELLSLVDQSQVNPPFNPVAFSNASPATNFSYWSSTQVSNSSSSAWTLTPSGSIHSQSKTSTSYTSGSASYTFYARCVRGGAVDPPAGLTVLSESVIDEATGLQWEREPLQLGMNHRDALAYCATLGKEGHDDWRLPTKKELESLLIWSKANPALDDSIAGDGEKTFTSANSNYWTSSLQQGVGPNAWYVSFSNGSMGIQGTGSSSYVRCVRDAGAAPSDCGDLTLHGDICVDPDTDPNHCGPGFVACDEGEICSGGSCVQAPDRDRVRWSVPGETRALEEFLIDEEEGTVEDLRTGLTWQRSAIEVRMTLDQATTYCRNLKIGGRADWRLPSITELLSLVEQSRQSPALNLSLFPEASTSSNYTYRSATEVQNSSGNTWALTSTGEIVSQSKTSTSSGSGSSLRYYYARCVRGGPDDNGASLLFGGETVSDPETGLQWQRNALPAFTASQPEALAYCENLDLDGFSDWRLPTKKELESIVDWKESGPAWAQAFTGTSTAYWTASAWLQNPNSSRWYVHFSSGNSGYTSPSSPYAVRCVRDAVVSTPSCGELDRCFDQICVDLQTDPRFCGNCLNACEEGEVCEGGTCVMAPDFNRARWVAPEEAPQASDYDTETYEGIVIDLRTQLHWQRDIYASFRMNHAAAVQYCRQLRLHGFSDWRLPTIIELLSLVDQSVQNPALNRDVFPDPLGRNGYWSNTEYENGKTNVWVLRPTGETATQSKTSVSSGSGSSLVTYFARCVRGGPASDVQPYTVEAETVWDPNTHLMWERAAPTGTFTLANAEGRCDTLNANAHGGYTDWRLPTKKELESLIHWNAYNPVFDAAFSGRNGTVWTSSPWVGSPASYRWQPNFSSGTVGYSNSSSGSRCVRSHPPPGP